MSQNDEPDNAVLANYSEDDRCEALRRYKIIQPFIEQGMTLAEVAGAHNVAQSTVWLWAKTFSERGIVGLVRVRRRDKDSRKLSQSLLMAIEGLALRQPRLSKANIFRRAAECAARLGEKPPTYKTVQRIVGGIEPGMLTLAHDGTRGYENAFDLVHISDAPRPNAVWQADHSVVDVLVSDRGRARKPWLTIILDDYSRAVSGYALSFSAPSALQTSLALRHAIWRKEHPNWQVCGVPDVLYTDHGSDFISRHVEQIAADIKFRLVFSLPGKPRGRGKIERFFRSMQQILLPRLPGYAPPGGSSSVKPVLTLAQLASEIESYLVHEHNLVKHSSTGEAPQARWEAGGFLPRLPESIEKLDLLLLTVPQARRIHRDGIKFMGYRYLNAVLAAHVGEYVIIRYDPRDIAVIRVYYRGAFLCRAVCQELAGQTVAVKEVVTARQRNRRELREKIRERTQLVESLLDMRRSDPPQREERAEVVSPTPQVTRPSSTLKRYRTE